MEDVIKKKAEENLKKSGEEHGKGLLNSSNPIEPIHTRAELAKAAGVSVGVRPKVSDKSLTVSIDCMA